MEHHGNLPKIRDFLRRHRLVILVFGVFYLAGLLAFRDYGVSADEPMGLWLGYQTYGYLFMGRGVPTLTDWTIVGPAWHLFLAIVGQLSGVEDARVLWLLRHFLNFQLFFAGTIVFYDIAKQCLKNERFALLATVFLMLSPRMFADAFYNPKDMPAMVFFLFAAATMLWFLRRPMMLRAALHAVACGILVSLRVFGLLIPLLTAGFLVIEPLVRGNRADVIRGMRIAALHLISACVLTIAAWPLLWTHPLTNFLNAVHNAGGREGGGWYFGQALTQTPWHYLPVWMFITTPVLYSLLFVTGVCVAVRDVIRSLDRALERKTDLLLLAWFFCAPLALIVLHAGIFDEWRHVLFIYPAFLLLAGRGVEWIWERMEGRNARNTLLGHRAVAILTGLSLCSTGYWMLTRHPFEYMYFSVPTQLVNGKFDLDYWNLGARQGLQWILDHDRTPVIKMYPAARIDRVAADTLPLNGWARIEWSNPDQADYILDNLRDSNYAPLLPDSQILHEIRVDGLSVVTIYRGPDTTGTYKPHDWLEDQRTQDMIQ